MQGCPIATVKPSRHATAADTSAAVDTFLETLQHPHLDAIHALREVILGADPRIADGIKWNAPRYRLGEYFAPTHLRAKTGVGIVLHLGAKVRANPSAVKIDDPAGLLQWLAPDRAMVAFADAPNVTARRDAFTRVQQQWLHHVDE